MSSKYVRPFGAWAVACVLFAGCLASASTASAFEIRKTTSGQPVHWATSSVSFVIDPSVTQAAPGAVDAAVQAAAAWSAQDGTPSLSTTAGTSPGQVAVDGVNTILYAPHGYERAGNALAITFVSFDEKTGEIVDTDIVINGAHAFSIFAAGTHAPAGTLPVATESGNGGDNDDLKFDLQHVLTHEMGHALGLGDVTDDAADVMFAYTMPDDASLRAPGSDDLAGVTELYADSASSPQSTSGGCGASVAAKRVPSQDGWVATACVLCAVAWLAVRRRTSLRPVPSRRSSSTRLGPR